ncbi:structural protein [Campylobacter sp. MIT 12-8780]|uniref:phage capsid family protein n=1 Tax=unclassified Campylobacter TaxID=2593542 RepID=UPI00115D85C9|nr:MULTISPECIES: DUF4043 family protein [unclassified Campylobacter]NDJ26364.1 DUF4043 family protein [Campylobacter sp. MIT 19-121]TQR42940.1 structural protein [Campylobacter sp. MIT 12-8780]
MPLNELNKIDIAGWRDNPNVSTQIATAIEKASWKKSPFEAILGKGSDRGLRSYSVKNTQPYRPRLKAALTGAGVRGNADFETNLDQLEILSQTIYPEVIGNSLKSTIKQYQTIEQIDFVKEASDSLSDWIREKRDRALFASLANDLTNCVVCDSANGFKDTTNEASVSQASKKVTQDDVMNVKAIRQAILMARTGKNYQGKDAFPMKPIRSVSHTEGGISIENYSYIILLDSYAIDQLKRDPEWIAMQKVGVRGDKNRLFTGLVGIIDECVVLDMGVSTPLQAGMLNSTISDEDFRANINEQNFSKIVPPSAYAGNTPVSIGFLIGASALVMAGSDSVNFYIDDSQDAGRKTICGVDRLMAISKARFESHNDNLSVYADTDFAVIGLFSAYR